MSPRPAWVIWQVSVAQQVHDMGTRHTHTHIHTHIYTLIPTHIHTLTYIHTHITHTSDTCACPSMCAGRSEEDIRCPALSLSALFP